MDRLSDFQLGMGVVIKANKDWRGVGRPQVAMHSQLPPFLVIIMFYDGSVSRTVKAWCGYFVTPVLLLRSLKPQKFTLMPHHFHFHFLQPLPLSETARDRFR